MKNAMQISAYQQIQDILRPSDIKLVAVSKTKSIEDIQSMYDLGQRDFGENYVQELLEKRAVLPNDIRWHFIGHLQTNKVKYIAPFIYMIQSVDSLKLLLEIDKHAAKNKRTILCLLQIFIASEESKFGLNEMELESLIQTVLQNHEEDKFRHSLVSGCMGMATQTNNEEKIRTEFKSLKKTFEKIKKAFPYYPVDTLSMGMSSDYLIAIESGSTMVRIGSLIFGAR